MTDRLSLIVRLKEIILEVANEFNSEIIEMEVMPDHVVRFV